jgi:hypothetical protein
MTSSTPYETIIGQRIYRKLPGGEYELIEEREPDGFPIKDESLLKDMNAVVDLHTPGAKDDSAKLPVELVPTEMIEAVAEIMDFGRKKYTEGGWKTVPDAYRRYMGALLRHAYAILRGELIDKDSGKPHVYHLACNAAFMCYFHKQGVACRVFEVKCEEA